LTEGYCTAANEKSARERGREPERFHDSDDLTNFAAAAQQNVRECHCARTGVTLTFLLSLTKEEKTHRSAKLRNSAGLKTAEDFY
jgi:hypothetical protein